MDYKKRYKTIFRRLTLVTKRETAHSFIGTFTPSLNQAFIVFIFMFIIQKEKKQSLFTWDQ